MPLKALVHTIASHLVVHTDQISVTERGGDHNSVIELRVAKSDLGKVIGRDGRTATSIRRVLDAAAAKIGRGAKLDIVE